MRSAIGGLLVALWCSSAPGGVACRSEAAFARAWRARTNTWPHSDTTSTP